MFGTAVFEVVEMKWSKLWMLKDYCIGGYCEKKKWVDVMNFESGKTVRIKLPPLVIELMKEEYKAGSRSVILTIKNALKIR